MRKTLAVGLALAVPLHCVSVPRGGAALVEHNLSLGANAGDQGGSITVPRLETVRETLASTNGTPPVTPNAAQIDPPLYDAAYYVQHNMSLAYTLLDPFAIARVASMYNVAVRSSVKDSLGAVGVFWLFVIALNGTTIVTMLLSLCGIRVTSKATKSSPVAPKKEELLVLHHLKFIAVLIVIMMHLNLPYVQWIWDPQALPAAEHAGWLPSVGVQWGMFEYVASDPSAPDLKLSMYGVNGSALTFFEEPAVVSDGPWYVIAFNYFGLTTFGAPGWVVQYGRAMSSDLISVIVFASGITAKSAFTDRQWEGIFMVRRAATARPIALPPCSLAAPTTRAVPMLCCPSAPARLGFVARLCFGAHHLSVLGVAHIIFMPACCLAPACPARL